MDQQTYDAEVKKIMESFAEEVKKIMDRAKKDEEKRKAEINELADNLLVVSNSCSKIGGAVAEFRESNRKCLAAVSGIRDILAKYNPEQSR